ncbi:DUF3018 family protein [Salmonella enterica]|nr:DUF3018 family protein [Salmonella enterica]
MSTKMEQEESSWLELCRRQAGIVAQADARDETTGDFLDESAADVDGWDE